MGVFLKVESFKVAIILNIGAFWSSTQISGWGRGGKWACLRVRRTRPTPTQLSLVSKVERLAFFGSATTRRQHPFF